MCVFAIFSSIYTSVSASERLLLIADWRVAHICAIAKRGGAPMHALWSQAGLPAPVPLASETEQHDGDGGSSYSSRSGADCISACRTAPQFIAFATANSVGHDSGSDADADASAADGDVGDGEGEGYVVVDSLDALQNTRAVGALMSCALCGDDEVAAADMAALWCAHAYCKACWRQWVKSSCEENAGGPLAHLRCMQHGSKAHGFGCDAKITVEFIDFIGMRDEYEAKYAQLFLDSYRWVHPRLRACANAACGALLLTAGGHASMHDDESQQLSLASSSDLPPLSVSLDASATAAASASVSSSLLPSGVPSLTRSQSTGPAAAIHCPLCEHERCANEACPYPAHHPAPCRVVRWWVEDGGMRAHRAKAIQFHVLMVCVRFIFDRCFARFASRPAGRFQQLITICTLNDISTCLHSSLH